MHRNRNAKVAGSSPVAGIFSEERAENMDQPTNIKIRIRGSEADVKRAALAAQKRIDRDTNGFREENYIFADETDLDENAAHTPSIVREELRRG